MCQVLKRFLSQPKEGIGKQVGLREKQTKVKLIMAPKILDRSAHPWKDGP